MEAYNQKECQKRFKRYEKHLDKSSFTVIQGVQKSNNPNELIQENGTIVVVPKGYKEVKVDKRFKDMMCPPAINITQLNKNFLNVEKWYQESRKHWLTIDKYLKLNKRTKVIMLDRNFADIAFDANQRGKAYIPTQFFRKNVAYLTPRSDGQNILACKLETSWGVSESIEFHIEYQKGFWYPLENGYLPKKDTQGIFKLFSAKKHWTDFPTSTHIGWRGPVITWEDLKKLPKLYHGTNPYVVER